jgi:cytochrome c oxidase subunit III
VSITILFLAVIAAIIVWFFLQQRLTAKPWLEEGQIVDLHNEGAFSLPAAKLGLRVFFAVVTVLFMLLIIAYGSRMQFEDWRPAPQLSLLWLNTAMLVLSSLAMQWALIGARRGETDSVMIGLIAGGVFAVAFLGGLHLLGGLVAWGRTTSKVLGGVDVADVRPSVELCTAYWHFLLLVWLVLFGLLFSANDNLGILLTICGIR